MPVSARRLSLVYRCIFRCSPSLPLPASLRSAAAGFSSFGHCTHAVGASAAAAAALPAVCWAPQDLTTSHC